MDVVCRCLVVSDAARKVPAGSRVCRQEGRDVRRLSGQMCSLALLFGDSILCHDSGAGGVET
jgi:hypothetical protein